MSTINVATLNHVKLKCSYRKYISVYSLYLDICIWALGASLPAAALCSPSAGSIMCW